jgi:hypothetical protein
LLRPVSGGGKAGRDGAVLGEQSRPCPE